MMESLVLTQSPQRERSVQHPRQTVRPRLSIAKPIWHLAIGWVLLIPMLYFAENGSIIPSMSGAFTSTDAAAGTSPRHKVEVAFLLLIILAVIAVRKAALLQTLVSSKLVMCLPLLALGSTLWSVQPLHSLMSGTILFMFTVFTICIAADFEFQRQVELLMLVGAVALPASIALALFLPSVGASGAWRGIFGHKQNCATVCTLWMITALHWRSRTAQRRLFKIAYILMCIVLIIMSQSRTGWLLACIALVLTAVLWAAQRMRRLEVYLGLLMSIPTLTAAAYAAHKFYALLATSVGKDATLSQRTIIWSAVWDAVLHRPYLGYGYSAFWNGLNGPSQRVVLISGWGIEQAQNGYLDVWLVMGLGGVVILAAMVANTIRASLKTAPSAASLSHKRWCLVVMITVLLLNIGESSIGLPYMSWFLFLLAYMGLQSLGRGPRIA